MILSTYVTFKDIKEPQGKTRIKSTEHVLQLPTTKNQLSFTQPQESFRECVVLLRMLIVELILKAEWKRRKHAEITKNLSSIHIPAKWPGGLSPGNGFDHFPLRNNRKAVI